MRNKYIFIYLLSFIFISSCATRYISDDEADILRNESMERLRAKVLSVLDGGYGPVTLIFVPGVQESLVSVSVTDFNICGLKVKRLYTFPDGSRVVDTCQVPNTEDERKNMTVCYRYYQFTNVKSGIFR